MAVVGVGSGTIVVVSLVPSSVTTSAGSVGKGDAEGESEERRE